MISLVADYDLRIEGTSETEPVVLSSIDLDTLPIITASTLLADSVYQVGRILCSRLIAG